MAVNDDTCAEIAGPGTHTYSEFLANCEECSEIENIYLVWAQGFMAALNIERALRGTPTKNVSAHTEFEQAALIRHLHEWRHPESYYLAVAAYFKSLPDCDALTH